MTSRTARKPAIGVDGLGYMGLATALGFSAKGWSVVGYDIQSDIRNTIRAGHSPFKEEGFERLVAKFTRRGTLRVVDSVPDLVKACDGVFLCLPTPQGPNGRIDLTAIKSGVAEIGKALCKQRGYRAVIVKSTVVPGTTSEVIEPGLRKLSRKGTKMLGVAVNPEFLAEGSALNDAARPERIVIGTTDKRTANWLRAVYAPFRAPVFELTPSGAELVKYSSNSFLAMKVSFANEISRITEKLGVNIDDVMTAVGKDSRIGQKFLKAGPGFGGSCFEKDLHALIASAEELGVTLRLAKATLLANEEQANHTVELVRKAAGGLNGNRIAFLGVAFKEGTDDVRESRAFPIIAALIKEGARIAVYDHFAGQNFGREWVRLRLPGRESIEVCDTMSSALYRSRVAVIHSLSTEDLVAAWGLMEGSPTQVVVDLRRDWKAAPRVGSGPRIIRLGEGQ